MTNKAHFTIEEIIKATNGTLINGMGLEEIIGVSTDSRSMERGNLFVALNGDNFDGHGFIGEAVEKGASCIVGSSMEIMEDKKKTGNTGFILVRETLNAYQDIARFHRKRFKPRAVVGITGSNGKTTTKEMSASVTGRRYRTLKNEANFNNHIGLPMSILSLSERDEVVVLEMGMRGEGEIRRLCEIAGPDIGVLTNIAPAHLELLGSVSGIRRAKGELIEALGEAGTAILNADDPNVISFRENYRGRVVSFGIEKEADVMGHGIAREDEFYCFDITIKEERAAVRLPFLGCHDIYNTLAAAALGFVLEIGLKEIVRGIELCRALPMRMNTIKAGNVTIINDAYNANPGSMRMAINTMSTLNSTGRKIFIAGDMLELGEKSEEFHREIGKLIARKGIDYFYTFGEMSGFAASEAIANGMAEDHVCQCDNYNDGLLLISKELEEGDCVMVKGSRGMRMERIVNGLKKIRMAPDAL